MSIQHPKTGSIEEMNFRLNQPYWNVPGLRGSPGVALAIASLIACRSSAQMKFKWSTFYAIDQRSRVGHQLKCASERPASRASAWVSDN